MQQAKQAQQLLWSGNPETIQLEAAQKHGSLSMSLSAAGLCVHVRLTPQLWSKAPMSMTATTAILLMSRQMLTQLLDSRQVPQGMRESTRQA